jgi:hypothetical protein
MGKKKFFSGRSADKADEGGYKQTPANSNHITAETAGIPYAIETFL